METGRHGRLPWLLPEQLDEDQHATYVLIARGPRAETAIQPFPLTDGAGRLQGPFNAMLISPTVGAALQGLGAALRFRSHLTPRTREIAILEVALHWQSDFEWFAHERIALEVGLSPGEVDALRRSEAQIDTFNSEESAVRDLVRALLKDHDLAEDAYAAAVGELGLVACMDLQILVGYYEILATSLRLWRTPLPDDVDSIFGESS